VGFAHSLPAGSARRVAGWSRSAAVAALVAAVGLGWLALDNAATSRLALGAGAPPPANQGLVAPATPATPAEQGGPPAQGLGPQPRPQPGSATTGVAASPKPDAGASSAGSATVAGANADRRVTVVVDGSARQVGPGEGTVGDLLARLGVELDGHDRVRPARDQPVGPGDRVVVERADVRRRQRQVAIAHGQRERATSALPAGGRRTVRQGRAGVVTITEELVEVGGDVVATREIARRTTRSPREAIIEVGTASSGEPAPSDEPEPSGEPERPGEPEASADAGVGDPAKPATWDRLAQCESGGNWQANTGNGFYGGLQFAAETWRSLGGSGHPHERSRQRQIEMGRRLHARRGWAPWPTCTRQLGYR